MVDGFNYKKNNSEDKFYSYEGKIRLTSKDTDTQDMFNKILSVFDKDNDGCLNSAEIKTIWDRVSRNCGHYTDENDDGVFSKKEIQDLINTSPMFNKIKITADELIKFLNLTDKTITKSFSKAFDKTSNNLQDKLKAKYPQDKYEIITASKNLIEIYGKKDNKIVMTCNIFGNGSYNFTYMKDNQAYKVENYDSSGNLKSYSEAYNRGDYIEWVDGDPISDAIHKDVSAKTKIGLPTTGKDIEKHIKQITSDNIIDVFSHYTKRYGETLLEAIDGEWGLDEQVKTRIKNHLNKCLIQSRYWQSLKPNAKLDGDFSQGNVGDCWFLASIAAVKRSPKGQKILDNTIKDNGDGTYTVKFKGADKKYTVTALEIMSKEDYADGDLDARILEIAANKHYLEGIYGGNPANALELLLGTGDRWINLLRNYSPKPNKEKIAELLKNPNIVLTASINPLSKLFGIVMNSVDDKEKYKEDIAIAHAYAIKAIDDKNIYLINPWYTDKTIKIPLNVFDDYWASVHYTEIK